VGWGEGKALFIMYYMMVFKIFQNSCEVELEIKTEVKVLKPVRVMEDAHHAQRAGGRRAQEPNDKAAGKR
jgi:hypothetical protein